MYMFNAKGDKATVVPEQIEALKKAGWTEEEPKKVAKNKQPNDTTVEAAAVANESAPDEEAVTGTSESTDDEADEATEADANAKSTAKKSGGIVLKRKN